MDFVADIIAYLKRKGTVEAVEAPESICPNCWGRQEYGGEFLDRIKQENLDISSSESNTGWIGAYASKHFKGIALVRKGNGNELICQKCKTSYQSK